jgi:ABC-type multidrug transport system fused ATPase/permease subunit
MTLYIINWLVDPKGTIRRGVILCSIFSALILTSIILRNMMIFKGVIMAAKVRKILVSSLYDKVGNLSIKAVTSTNSGKLVTLVSADIFMMERALSMAPMLFSAPFSNLSVVLAIGFTTGWINAGIVIVVWIIMMVMQFKSGHKQKELKSKEGMQNDGRIKLITDMLSGIRTIKSYGWENHYTEKIGKSRKN